MVGNEHHAHAFGLQVIDHAKQLVNLPAGQRGGGLIQNEHTRIHRQRLSNFHQLLAGNAQFADGGVQRHVYTDHA